MLTLLSHVQAEPSRNRKDLFISITRASKVTTDRRFQKNPNVPARKENLAAQVPSRCCGMWRLTRDESRCARRGFAPCDGKIALAFAGHGYFGLGTPLSLKYRWILINHLDIRLPQFLRVLRIVCQLDFGVVQLCVNHVYRLRFSRQRALLFLLHNSSL